MDSIGKVNFTPSPAMNNIKAEKKEAGIVQGAENEAIQDKVDVKPGFKDRFKEKMAKVKTALTDLKTRTYLTSTGIGGIGLGVLGGFIFGPAGAVVGAIAGIGGGLGVGALMNSPMTWFKGNKNAEKVPPGSDVNLKPDIKESALLSPAVQKKVDQFTNSEVVKGNKTTLLKNGATSFPERYRMMENAKHSINLQTLIFHSDEAGWKTANLLAKKASEGVKCRVIYDWISSTDTDPKLFKTMRDAGVEVMAFNTPLDYKWHGENVKDFKDHVHEGFEDFAKTVTEKDISNLPEWTAERGEKNFEYWKNNNKKVLERLKEYPPLLHKLNNRWHMKILSVDGDKAVIGGLNIGSEYANGGTDHRDMSAGPGSFSSQAFRDTDMKAEGPIVTTINKTFAENWVYAGGDKPESITTENPEPKVEGNISTRFIGHLPREKKDKNIENWYYQMLGNAKKTAYITNAYFIPTKKFRKALIDAAKRGVDVRVLTNSVGTNDLPLITQAARQDYREMLKGGVRLYELKKDNPGNFTTLHTKGAVFDAEVSTVGSHNLDPRSFNLNSEDTMVIQDKEFSGQMQQMFKSDLEMSDEVTLVDLNKETPADQLEQWFAAKVLNELL